MLLGENAEKKNFSERVYLTARKTAEEETILLGWERVSFIIILFFPTLSHSFPLSDRLYPPATPWPLFFCYFPSSPRNQLNLKRDEQPQSQSGTPVSGLATRKC